MNKGLINRILPFSAVDGPGNRAVIFMQGCNFNCLYCHNPETINQCDSCGACLAACASNALDINDGVIGYDLALCEQCDECIKICPNTSSPRARNLTALEVMAEIAAIRAFITGITVSGGECSLQIEFLTELFSLAKANGLNTLADSNGSRLFAEFPDFLQVCDGVMLDVKAVDLTSHLELTSQPNHNVLANLDFLAHDNKLYEVRSVIVPELLDNQLTVTEVSQRLAKISPNTRYKLIKYRSHGVRTFLLNSISPSTEYMQQLAKIAIDNGLMNVIIV